MKSLRFSKYSDKQWEDEVIDSRKMAYKRIEQIIDFGKNNKITSRKILKNIENFINSQF